MCWWHNPCIYLPFFFTPLRVSHGVRQHGSQTLHAFVLFSPCMCPHLIMSMAEPFLIHYHSDAGPAPALKPACCNCIILNDLRNQSHYGATLRLVGKVFEHEQRSLLPALYIHASVLAHITRVFPSPLDFGVITVPVWVHWWYKVGLF